NGYSISSKSSPSGDQKAMLSVVSPNAAPGMPRSSHEKKAVASVSIISAQRAASPPKHACSASSETSRGNTAIPSSIISGSTSPTRTSGGSNENGSVT